MSFPAYPRYRDSGVEWLGDVPSHWTVTPLKVQAAIIAGQSPNSNDCNLDGFGRPFLQGCAEFGDLHPSPKLFCEVPSKVSIEGDILLSVRAPVGALNISDQSYGIGRGLCAIRAISVASSYLRYALSAGVEELQSVATGSTYQAVSTEQIGSLRLPVPPLTEQTAIAAFLDRETAKIDAMVDEQGRLIELLKEKRQAVISHAVTKGLDPTVPIRDSGVEWLGDVPAHWQVKPLKYLTPSNRAIMYGIVMPGPDVGSGIPIVKGGDVKGHRLSLDTLCYTTAEIEAPYARARLHPNDIVYSIRGSIGDAELVPADLLDANITQDVARISPIADVNPHWLLNVMRSKPVFAQLEQRSLGATIRGINIFDLKRAYVPVPPREEQDAIAGILSIQLDKLSELSRSAAASIELMREHRAALISAAVTGKIDVCGSAVVLPLVIDRDRARALVGTEIVERLAPQPTFGRVKLQKIAFLAEAHVGVSELAGSYTREAAGPLDRTMIHDMEGGARSIAGVAVQQAGGTGTAVSYQLNQERGSSRQELADWLGVARTAKLDNLIADLAGLSTAGSEAVATLYAVWNDALIAGVVPTDNDIVSGFLEDWHPEKRQKFSADELHDWLDWMRRHDIVPAGRGPRTTTGRLFA